MMGKRSRPQYLPDRPLRLAYMGNRCLGCGESVEEVEREYLTSHGCFEFNHVDPTTKAPDYERLIRRIVSAMQLDELDKCVLLCVKCHRIYQSQNLQGSGTFIHTLASGLVLKEDFRFTGILNFGKQSLRLFGSDPKVIGIYRCRLGDGPVEVKTAKVMESSLLDLFKATKEGGEARIWDEKGLVLTARRQNSSKARIEFGVRFPLMQCEFLTDEPTPRKIWVRKGKMVDRIDGIRETGAFSFSARYDTIDRGIQKSRERTQTS